MLYAIQDIKNSLRYEANDKKILLKISNLHGS